MSYFGTFNQDFQLRRFPFDVQVVVPQVRFTRRDRIQLQPLQLTAYDYKRKDTGNKVDTAIMYHANYYNVSARQLHLRNLL